MSKLDRLFTSMNLNIEANKTITKIDGGIRTTVTCNKKPIKLDGLVYIALKNRNKSITFSTNSKTKDCSYLFLERYIHEALSSRINFIVSAILQLAYSPEMYNHIKSQNLKKLLLKFVEGDLIDFDNTSDNNLLSKWNKITESISEKFVHNGLTALKYKSKYVFVEDEVMIEYYRNVHKISDDKKYTFTYFTSYISVEFSLYNLLKTTKNKLLGVQFEKNELEVLKAIFQYIFENIEKKNFYSSLDSSLLDKKYDEKEEVYIVANMKNHERPSILLIESFNLLTTHIDTKLDDIIDIDKLLVQSKKFNLNLTEGEMNEFKSYNQCTQNSNFGSVHDLRYEIESHPRIKLQDLNKQLNEGSAKFNKGNPTNQPKVKKSQSYKKSSRSFMSSQGSSLTSLFGITRSENNSNVLDSTNDSFELKIPTKERKRHTYILAGSGSGKTSLLETFLYADCQKKNQSTIIFDLMGKATNSILKFVKDPSKLVIIDPYLHASISPIINPFELESKDELSIEDRTKAIINAFDIALKLKDGWSVNMRSILEPCVSTLLRKGDSDIYELQRFVNDEYNTDLVELGKSSPIRGHRNMFNQEFHNESYDVTKRAISAKLQVFLNDPILAQLITGISTINLAKEVNTEGKIIIFKLPSKQKIFARLMMEMIQDIMRQRINLSDDKIVPTHIYLDEFQNYLTPTIEEVLSESRNYKCYVTFAHQSFVHLDRKMQGIVLSNSNIKIVGQCSYDDGKKMAKEMKAKHETIEDLDQGEFLFKIGSKDVFQSKNTDRFINDKTPYHTKLSVKHIKHQFKNYYVSKNIFLLKNDTAIDEIVMTPKHEDF